MAVGHSHGSFLQAPPAAGSTLEGGAGSTLLPMQEGWSWPGGGLHLLELLVPTDASTRSLRLP